MPDDPHAMLNKSHQRLQRFFRFQHPPEPIDALPDFSEGHLKFLKVFFAELLLVQMEVIAKIVLNPLMKHQREERQPSCFFEIKYR